MRVYIQGRSVISPTGRNLGDHLSALYNGDNRLGQIQVNGSALLPSHILENLQHLKKSSPILKNFDNSNLLAIFSVLEAVEESGGISDGAGVIFGSSRGVVEKLEEFQGKFQGGERIPAFSSPVTTSNSIPSSIARYFSVIGPHMFVSGACSTSLHSVGLGFAMLQAGYMPEVVVGGVEYANTPLVTEMLRNARVLTKKKYESFPHRPAAEDRSGMVLSSGASSMLLGLEDRGLGEVVGYGAATDKGGLTGVSEEAEGLQIAIKQALARANISPQDVGFIVGHGSSTEKGDLAELKAIRQVFGDLSPKSI